MSDMAKKARAAMKAKAQSMTTDPQQKVDSSNWTPSEPLNAGIKTGMRPVSRAKFKSGGKVSGKHAKMNLGHKPRATGGTAQPLVDRLINRDVKKANEYRDGIKHVGGMKRGGKAYCGGGRTMKEDGGRLRSESTQYEKARRRAVDEAENYDMDPAYTEDTLRKATRDFERTAAETGNKRGGRIHKAMGGSDDTLRQLNAGVAPSQMGHKKGGRTHKADGGTNRIDAGVPSSMMSFTSGRSPAWQIAKRGGKIKHGDEAADKALIRKMVKPSARKGHAEGGSSDDDDNSKYHQYTDPSPKRYEYYTTRKKGGSVEHDDVAADKALIRKMVKPSARKGKNDGGVSVKKIPMGASGLSPAEQDKWKKSLDAPYTGAPFNKSGYPDYEPKSTRELSGNLKFPAESISDDYKKGGRTKHASGGKTKLHLKEKGGSVYSGPSYPGKVPGAVGGRTAHKHGGKTGKMAVHVNINTKPDAMMPMGAGPGAGPMPMPPIPAGLIGGRPLNPAQLGGGPAPMPGGAPPMPMAGGAPPMGAPAMGARPPMQPIPRKSGGRLTKKASSYKDMEAGSGSGEGRLQKTDIARRH